MSRLYSSTGRIINNYSEVTQNCWRAKVEAKMKASRTKDTVDIERYKSLSRLFEDMATTEEESW